MVDPQVQKTTRPDTIWPEEWPRLSTTQQRVEIASWDEEENSKTARWKWTSSRSADKGCYLKVISEARETLET